MRVEQGQRPHAAVHSLAAQRHLCPSDRFAARGAEEEDPPSLVTMVEILEQKVGRSVPQLGAEVGFVDGTAERGVDELDKGAQGMRGDG